MAVSNKSRKPNPEAEPVVTPSLNRTRTPTLRDTPARSFCLYAVYVYITVGLCLTSVVVNASPSKPGAAVPSDSLASELKRDDPQCTVEENNRFDCWPEVKGAKKKACEKRGCCWNPKADKGVPSCYFPTDYGGYKVKKVNATASGLTAVLSRTGSSMFPPDIENLKLQIDFQTESRLRIRIFDPKKARFQPPVQVPSGSKSVTNPLYKVIVPQSSFKVVVTRVSTNATVFDTSDMAPFIFADQFLQIGTRLSTNYLYGLGEHRYKFLHQVDTWRKLVFWNHDLPPTKKNGYGSHPFFLNLEPAESGKSPDAHGVLLLNSNAAEAALQPYGKDKAGAVTFRAIGGVVDLFVMLGPSPLSVAAQYTEVVGRPYMPPFWSLGFHLCRWGYNSSSGLMKVIKRNRDAGMPYDVQWGDIDYMDKHKDWTYNPKDFSDLPVIVSDLQKKNQRYIIMADPAISSSQPNGTYKPFDDGKKMDIFIKDYKGDILVGNVWPGETAYPDFFHPNSYDYWLSQAKAFHKQIPFDGLWLDMNEPVSFTSGSVKGCDAESSLDYPPYTPGTIDGDLMNGTICPSSKQYLSSHYNLHNMYGWSQANVSRGVVDTLYDNKRSPLISRSTFVGSGKFTGHWLGDNHATFKDLAFSIDGILNFNLFGIPFVGADICGFSDDTSPELCTRWHQLGVFYPFMRNHNEIYAKDQDPASFKRPYVDYIRKALELRYQLLSVLYTNFFKAHSDGLPVVRPLFFLYPEATSISRQFMWGDQLLVSPVIKEGATSVEAFLPKDTWYDMYSGAQVIGQGEKVTLSAPLDTINVHIRGGSILPLLPPTLRTDLSRKQKYTLVVASGPDGTATGQLFWDDGESRDSITAKKYSLIEFNFEGKSLTNSVAVSGYKPHDGIYADQVTFLGITEVPSKVTVDGNLVDFRYEALQKKLTAFYLTLNLLEPFKLTWV